MNLPWLKAAVAFFGAVVGGIAIYTEDNVITSGETVQIVALVVTLVGVYFIPNVRNGANVNTTARNAVVRRYPQ